MEDLRADRGPVATATCSGGDEVILARQVCYQFFATVLSDPRGAGWKRVLDPDYSTLVSSAAQLLCEQAVGLDGGIAPGERLPTELDTALEFACLPFERVAPEYQRIFGFLLSKDCPPYESEYCPQTFSIYRSQRMGDVAGFYQAFGLEPGREVPERHDHIALEMEFMAWLIGKERHARRRRVAEAREQAGICRDAQVKFFGEHLAWWVPAFCAALWRKAEAGQGDGAAEEARTFYGRIAKALSAFVAFERLSMGIQVPAGLVAPRSLDEAAEMTCGGCELPPAEALR